MSLIERVAKKLEDRLDEEFSMRPGLAQALAYIAIEAMRLTDNDWPENVRHYDDIAAFNDVIDIALGVAQPTEPAE